MGKIVTARTVFVPLSMACALFVAAVFLDRRTVAALRTEHGQLARGPVVDRHGVRLAWLESSDAGVKQRFALPSLAAALGYSDPAGSWNGLEGKYDATLTTSQTRGDWQSFWLHLGGGTTRGDTLALTIDAHVQRTADRALGTHMGAVVALDPRTGDVLALVSKPYCHPAQLTDATVFRRCERDPHLPLVDRATQRLFAPGSAFKIVTLSAALASGHFHLSDVLSGVDAFGPSPYFNNVTYPSNVTRPGLTQLTLAQALAFSDNFAFAHVGLTLGSNTLLGYAHRYMIDRPIPFDVPVATSTIGRGTSHLSLGQTARASFGAPDDQVTPLQMALIAAGVANGGAVMAPHIARALVSPAGSVVWRFHPHVLSRVMSPEAARQVTDGMVFVVTAGSGFNAAIPGMAVAGKTGTAASGGNRANAWFISFAPAYHPRVAVAVLVEYSGEGFQYAAPIARQVMEAALQKSAHNTSSSGG